MLQWQVCLRRDPAFTVKELARCLSGPTEGDFNRLKHPLRYIKGALRYNMALRLSATLPPEAGQEVYLLVYVDANWAECPSTRKSTSGALFLLFACSIHFVTKTQSMIVLSSAESELYANGTGSGEPLHIGSFLLETGLGNNINVSVETDSPGILGMHKF